MCFRRSVYVARNYTIYRNLKYSNAIKHIFFFFQQLPSPPQLSTQPPTRPTSHTMPPLCGFRLVSNQCTNKAYRKKTNIIEEKLTSNRLLCNKKIITKRQPFSFKINYQKSILNFVEAFIFCLKNITKWSIFFLKNLLVQVDKPMY